jgi:hypothetical protein
MICASPSTTGCVRWSFHYATGGWRLYRTGRQSMWRAHPRREPRERPVICRKMEPDHALPA